MSAISAKTGTTIKPKSSKRRDVKASPPPLKVVVRRLPHDMAEAEVVSALMAAATEAGLGECGGCWDMLYVAPGKMSKKRGLVTGTAYLRLDRGRGMIADLRLIKLRAAVLASEAMVGGTGVPAKEKSTDKAMLGPVVEPAPFQKLFRTKPKRDARVGTIERDPDYKAFCTKLDKLPTPLPSADVQAENRESEPKDQAKPPNALLDYLNERTPKRGKDNHRPTSSTTIAGTSSRGSKRASSRSTGAGAGGGSLPSSSGDGSEATGATLAMSSASQAATGTSGMSSKRQGPEASRAPSRALVGEGGGKSKARDAERDKGKGRASRGGSNSPRPPPSSSSQKSAALPPPLPSVREEDPATPGPPSSTSGTEFTKGRPNSKGSGRAAGKGNRAGAPTGANSSNTATVQPSAILMKQKDTPVPVTMATLHVAAAASDLSPTSSGTNAAPGRGKGETSAGSARGGRGRAAGNGGGKGRTTGNPGRGKGAGGNGGS